MASSPPKRPRVFEEEGVVQGYLHGVTPVRISENQNKTAYFNCYWQTSRDEWRRCVVFAVEKHGSYRQAADNHTPLKLCNAGNIKSNVGAGQRDIRINYKSTEKVLKSLDFGYIENPSIPNSVEEALVPESVARQRLEVDQQEVEQDDVEQPEEEEQELEQVEEEEEVEQEGITTVRGPVCGVQLADQRKCSSCHKGQLAFNIKAINHRCDFCGLLQRVRSYVQASNGTVVVNKGDVKLTLTLTSTVLMTYLSQNNLQELLADVQLVEGHFLVGVFEIKYNANNEVVVVTTGNV